MGIYPEVGLLDYIVILFLVFWGTFLLISIVAAPIYIPANSAKGSLFFQHFPILISCLFDNNHPSRCEVISCHGFDLHVPQWCWASFHVLVDHLYVFFGKMSVQVLCPFYFFAHFLIWWFVAVSHIISLYILNINLLSYIRFANIFS